MEYHLDRSIGFNPTPKYAGLYPWSIVEREAGETQVGPDWIPWEWTVSFRATSCTVSDDLELGTYSGESKSAERAVRRRVVRFKLREGHRTDNFEPRTTLSMFGTTRAFVIAELDVMPLEDGDTEERCVALGFPAYADDNDFVRQSQDDYLGFYLLVHKQAFWQLAENVKRGVVKEVIFSAGAVDGFYSTWTPDITTSAVKILTQGDAQPLTPAPPGDISLPRLGKVGRASLSVSHQIEFPQLGPSLSRTDAEEMPVPALEGQFEPILQDHNQSKQLQQLVAMAAPVRKAAWLVSVASIVIMWWVIFHR